MIWVTEEVEEGEAAKGDVDDICVTILGYN